ncbi:MAG TPA: hypothetical protein VMP67_03575 [Candidatus Limnocylindria bacterium]|nr:hypothetical protein [Candidatus Limnocylindria bacterium]
MDAAGNLVGVAFLVDASGYMNELDVWAVGSDINGRPTVTAHGRPSIDSLELAPADGETFNLLDLTRGRASHGKN